MNAYLISLYTQIPVKRKMDPSSEKGDVPEQPDQSPKKIKNNGETDQVMNGPDEEVTAQVRI